MQNIHGKLLTDEQASLFKKLWDAWMSEIDAIPPLNVRKHQLDSRNDPFRDLEHKYQDKLYEILNAAPDANELEQAIL